MGIPWQTRGEARARERSRVDEASGAASVFVPTLSFGPAVNLPCPLAFGPGAPPVQGEAAATSPCSVFSLGIGLSFAIPLTDFLCLYLADGELSTLPYELAYWREGTLSSCSLLYFHA